MKTEFNGKQFDCAEMLHTAITEPGLLHAGFRAFHRYSARNQMLASRQLLARGLSLTPIDSYMGWKAKGRIVKKGEKAISLYMPVIFKGKNKGETGEVDEGNQEGMPYIGYIPKNNWFSFEQTEGEPFEAEVTVPEWDTNKAMSVLNIEEVPFSHVSGGMFGYALRNTRKIAINPTSPDKLHTRLHEIAHIVLGHTETASHEETLPKDIKEVEAESTAYILANMLGIGSLESSRAYIQHYLETDTIEETNAKRIFKAVDSILKAGLTSSSTSE